MQKTEKLLIEPGQEGGCQCGAIRYRLLREPDSAATLRTLWKDAQSAND